jgi:hypothetical protein
MQRHDLKEQKELLRITNQLESTSIGIFDLQVGQWVIFQTDKPIETLTNAQKDIFNRPFLVVTREDAFFDSCRCTLIGEDDKTYDYCPRVRTIGNASLADDHGIFIILSQKIESIFGKEKLESIYENVQKHLDSMAEYFKKYPAQKLDIESLKIKLHTGSQNDEKDYSLYCIPSDVLRFFSEEQGLNPEMLLMNGYKGRQKKYSCDMINTFRRVTFPLIKFYLETPQLSVENLLNYDEYAIRDFACHDKDFQFHKWLLENKLTMPSTLVGNWSNIAALCDSSGIEYLNRKILSLSKDKQQSKLNELATGNCYNDKTICLQDVLVSPNEVSWDTVENRFLKFKEKEKAVAEKYTRGPTSLMWLSAKKVSKVITQEQANELPKDFQRCINAAKPF